MSIYERFQERRTLWVRLRHPSPGQQSEPFEVRPLLLLGEDYYVTEDSEWARFASLGGVVINGTRYQMEESEMQAWCEALEEVEE